ncbi:thiol-activated cytolysin family protein [Streptomyces sp. NPDC048352]|uniref:thiol-activated cytolysin family protein n=1 Tax=Streptomyces sp. NPDC048352 TaxID=3154718 RepID=UPI0034190E45
MLVLAVHYGRTLVFTLTSSTSETEIEAAVKASYTGFAGASAEAKARYQSVLKNSSIQIIAQGVDVDVLRELANGSIAKIFDKTHKFKEYVPLGYTLATLKGEVTKMSEATEYDAVSWGGIRVELEIPSICLGMATTQEFDITINGTVYKAKKNQPAKVTRTFENDGTGPPFHVTSLKGSGVDWKLGPYDLKWFQNGPTYSGKYPAGEELATSMTYTARRG